MARIRKCYFTLDELLVAWGFAESDLRYVAENGLLRLSIRVVGMLMEFGSYEETQEGRWFSVPYEHRPHDGLLELGKRDVFLLFRDGVVEPRYFPRPGGEYARLLRDTDALTVRLRDLVVDAAERLRFEAEVLPTLRVDAHDFPTFSDFWHQGRRYRFTPTQAAVLQLLHDMAAAGTPWQSGKAALAASGSHTLKLGDLFKRRPEWRELVEADGRGYYRLVPTLIRRRAA